MFCILDIVLSFSPAGLISVYSIKNGAINDRWRLMDAASSSYNNKGEQNDIWRLNAAPSSDNNKEEDDEDWRAFVSV